MDQPIKRSLACLQSISFAGRKGGPMSMKDWLERNKCSQRVALGKSSYIDEDWPIAGLRRESILQSMSVDKSLKMNVKTWMAPKAPKTPERIYSARSRALRLTTRRVARGRRRGRR